MELFGLMFGLPFLTRTAGSRSAPAPFLGGKNMILHSTFDISL